MKRHRLCGIFLLFFVHNVQLISSLENVYSVVRGNGIRARSISKDRAEIMPDLPLADERILSTLLDILDVINTPQCKKDFNATLAGIQLRQPWAVASM